MAAHWACGCGEFESFLVTSYNEKSRITREDIYVFKKILSFEQNGAVQTGISPLIGLILKFLSGFPSGNLKKFLWSLEWSLNPREIFNGMFGEIFLTTDIDTEAVNVKDADFLTFFNIYKNSLRRYRRLVDDFVEEDENQLRLLSYYYVVFRKLVSSKTIRVFHNIFIYYNDELKMCFVRYSLDDNPIKCRYLVVDTSTGCEVVNLRRRIDEKIVWGSPTPPEKKLFNMLETLGNKDKYKLGLRHMFEYGLKENFLTDGLYRDDIERYFPIYNQLLFFQSIARREILTPQEACYAIIDLWHAAPSFIDVDSFWGDMARNYYNVQFKLDCVCLENVALKNNGRLNVQSKNGWYPSFSIFIDLFYFGGIKIKQDLAPAFYITLLIINKIMVYDNAFLIVENNNNKLKITCYRKNVQTLKTLSARLIKANFSSEQIGDLPRSTQEILNEMVYAPNLFEDYYEQGLTIDFTMDDEKNIKYSK